MNTTLVSWISTLAAVAFAIFGNLIGQRWASNVNEHGWYNAWLFALLVVSPLVFITFGVVTQQGGGLSTASGKIDGMLIIGTVLVGIIFQRDYQNMSGTQLIGLCMGIASVVMLHIK